MAQTPHRTDPSRGWVGIFNRSKSDRGVSLGKQDLGFVVYEQSYNLMANRNEFLLHDVWSDTEFRLREAHRFTLPAEGVVFLAYQKVTP